MFSYDDERIFSLLNNLTKQNYQIFSSLSKEYQNLLFCYIDLFISTSKTFISGTSFDYQYEAWSFGPVNIQLLNLHRGLIKDEYVENKNHAKLKIFINSLFDILKDADRNRLIKIFKECEEYQYKKINRLSPGICEIMNRNKLLDFFKNMKEK